MEHQRGWFFHFVNLRTGAREWAERAVVDRHGAAAGRRAHRASVLRRRPRRGRACATRSTGGSISAGCWPAIRACCRMGGSRNPASCKSRWDHYCELMILYLLGHRVANASDPGGVLAAWRRPTVTFERYSYVGGPPPLFVHQYAHAWVDFRGLARARTAADRLVRELRRSPRARTALLPDAGRGVSRLHGRTCGASPRRTAARATSPGAGRRATRTDRRQRRAERGGRLADVRAGHHAARGARDARSGSAIASTGAMGSPTRSIRPTAG